MSSEEVAAYLKANPEFFEEHPALLDHMTVSHPQDGRAISLVERQLGTLREKNASLEAKLRELIIFGSHNDVLADKLHRLTLALLRAEDLEMTLGVLIESLKTDFAIPQAVIRWWDGTSQKTPHHTAFSLVSDGMRDYVSGLRAPYVGPLSAHESGDWLPPGSTVQSYAYAPLRTDVCAGVLMLASEDGQRFTPDMATDVLTRLSELATVAIERYVDAPSLLIA
jgi:uncharacterized protein